MMLFSTVLFCSLLVRTSLATCPVVYDNVTPETVARDYAKGSATVPIPTIEFNDNWGRNFAHSDTVGVKEYGISLLYSLEHQAKAAGQQLIYDINEYSSKLDRSIESTHVNKEPYCCDLDLERVTNQLVTLLSLKPGQVVKRSVFPPFPTQYMKVISQTKPRSLPELFLTLGETLERDSTAMHAFRNNILLSGWHRVRRDAYRFAMRIRRVILNELVLDAYRYAVEKLLQKSDLIRKYVNNESWQAFTATAQRVIQASDDYRMTKECRPRTAAWAFALSN